MEMKSSFFHFIRIVKIKKGDGVMPTFANPFSGNVERKVSKQELIQAIRLDIAAELEAIFIYDAHIQATDDVFVKINQRYKDEGTCWRADDLFAI